MLLFLRRHPYLEVLVLRIPDSEIDKVNVRYWNEETAPSYSERVNLHVLKRNTLVMTFICSNHPITLNYMLTSCNPYRYSTVSTYKVI